MLPAAPIGSGVQLSTIVDRRAVEVHVDPVPGLAAPPHARLLVAVRPDRRSPHLHQPHVCDDGRVGAQHVYLQAGGRQRAGVNKRCGAGSL
jgi:hypothetical protein